MTFDEILKVPDAETASTLERTLDEEAERLFRYRTAGGPARRVGRSKQREEAHADVRAFFVRDTNEYLDGARDGRTVPIDPRVIINAPRRALAWAAAQLILAARKRAA